MSIAKKILLDESDIPDYYYNIQSDMPNPTLPPLHPGTKKPIGPEDLAPLFPMELIKQSRKFRRKDLSKFLMKYGTYTNSTDPHLFTALQDLKNF